MKLWDADEGEEEEEGRVEFTFVVLLGTLVLSPLVLFWVLWSGIRLDKVKSPWEIILEKTEEKSSIHTALLK